MTVRVLNVQFIWPEASLNEGTVVLCAICLDFSIFAHYLPVKTAVTPAPINEEDLRLVFQRYGLIPILSPFYGGKQQQNEPDTVRPS
jgi:hypothetical protein